MMTPRVPVLPESPGTPTTDRAGGEDERTLASVLPEQRPSRAGDLLQFAGTWEGDDLEECLDAVYATRGVWYPGS